MQDVAEAEGQVSPALLQRLILKPQKIQQLADGIRAIAAQEEPIRRVLQRMEVAEGANRRILFGELRSSGTRTVQHVQSCSKAVRLQCGRLPQRS